MADDFDGNNQSARLLLAKGGNAKAFEELLAAYSPLIESMVSAFLCYDSETNEQDDLRQEASLAFYNAVDAYDPHGAVGFGAFAKVCIRNRLISYGRKKRREPHTVSLEGCNVEPVGTDPAESVVEEESYLTLYRRIATLLSPFENRVWWLYLSGRCARDIALQVGKDEKSVQNAIYRIRTKLKNALPNPFMPE